MPVAANPVAVANGTEREVLAAFLDFHRDVVVRKVAGLSLPQARHRLVPSDTTLAGLLRHLAVTEREWFQQILAGQPAPRGEGSGEPGFSWVVSEDDSLDRLIEQYQQECDRSRTTAASLDLDHVVPHPVLGQVSLRWIYVHMVEETARHAGHADILRELTDGATGVM